MAKLGKIGTTYYLYFTDPATRKTRRKSLHTSNKAEANSALAEYVMSNRNAKAQETPLFSTAFANFLLVKNYPSQTIKMHKNATEHFYRCLPDKAIGDYTQEDYFNLVKYFEKRGSSRNTVSLNVKKIVTFFNWCISNGLIDKHPFKKISEQVNEVRVVYEDYFIKIINLVQSKTVKDALWVLLLTGLRIGELLSLKIRDIDFERDLIYIKNTKAKRDDVIPLLPNVRAILEGYRWKQQEELIFRISSTHIRREFRKAQRGDKYKVHDLRRTCATMLSRYVSPFVLQRYLRHADIKVTMKYYVRSDLEIMREELKGVRFPDVANLLQKEGSKPL